MRIHNPLRTAAGLIFFIMLLSCAGSTSIKGQSLSFVMTFSIMGEGIATEKELARFLKMNNRNIKREQAFEMARLYIEEGQAEGVNYDLAFCQMCLETGFLRYGGDVAPEQNNFCGLGATGGGNPGLSFPDSRTGVRAHIQHLKAYGSLEPLNRPEIDPRFRYVKRGRAGLLYDLAGTWAADPAYGFKLEDMMNRLHGLIRKKRHVKII